MGLRRVFQHGPDRVRRPVAPRLRLCGLAALVLGAGALGGCSTNIAELPYPSVHDMPPARSNTMLSSDEQQKVQQDLTTTRDSIEARAQHNAQQYAAENGAAPAATGSTGPTKSASAVKPGG